jgi:hypothetical protein
MINFIVWWPQQSHFYKLFVTAKRFKHQECKHLSVSLLDSLIDYWLSLVYILLLWLLRFWWYFITFLLCFRYLKLMKHLKLELLNQYFLLQRVKFVINWFERDFGMNLKLAKCCNWLQENLHIHWLPSFEKHEFQGLSITCQQMLSFLRLHKTGSLSIPSSP